MSGKLEEICLFAAGGWLPRNATFAIVCVALLACCMSCGTTADTKDDDQPLVSTWRDGLHLPQPLVEELTAKDVALAAKIDLEQWERVQLFFDEAVRRMSKLTGEKANPRDHPINMLLDRLGGAAVRNQLDQTRSLYLTLSTQTSPELKACLVTGLLCADEAISAPLFGRVLLPITDGSAVKEALREEWSDYVIVREYDGYLSVDFFLDAPADSQLARRLLEQRADRDKHLAQARITPAMVHFLRFDGALAAYGRFDGLLGLGQLIETQLNAPTANRPSGGDALTETIGTAYRVNAPRILHDPESAQFEDVGIFLRATSNGGLRLDLAMTPTPLGAEAARATRLEFPIPPLPEMDVLVEIGFAANISRLGEMGRVPRWSAFAGEEVVAYHRRALPWSVLSVLSAPSFSVESFFPEYMQYYSAVAGRMRLGSMPQQAKPSAEGAADEQSSLPALSLETLRGAVYLIVDNTLFERSELRELADQVAAAGIIQELEVAETAEERLELRGAYPTMQPEWFDRPDHPPEHASISLLISPDGSNFSRQFLYGIEKRSGLTGFVLLNELNWSFAARAKLQERQFHLVAYLGPGDGDTTAPADWQLENVAGFEQSQPESTCFDKLFRLGAHGLKSPQMPIDEYAAHLDAIESEFLDRADECAEAAANPKLARLAQARFFWTRAQLARYLPDRDQLLPSLEEACARGMERACREMEDAQSAP